MKRLHVLLPATVTLITLACPTAFAQWAWQWRDEKGHMVYSDAAPPPSERSLAMFPVPLAVSRPF